MTNPTPTQSAQFLKLTCAQSGEVWYLRKDIIATVIHRGNQVLLQSLAAQYFVVAATADFANAAAATTFAEQVAAIVST